MQHMKEKKKDRATWHEVEIDKTDDEQYRTASVTS